MSAATTFRAGVLSAGPNLNGDAYTPESLRQVATLIAGDITFGYDGPVVGKVVDAQVRDGLVEVVVALDRTVALDPKKDWVAYTLGVEEIECSACHRRWTDVTGMCDHSINHRAAQIHHQISSAKAHFIQGDSVERADPKAVIVETDVEVVDAQGRVLGQPPAFDLREDKP